MSKYELHVSGMHCNSCAIMIEETLKRHDGVEKAKVSFEKKTAFIEGDFGGKELPELASFLSLAVEKYGYAFSTEKAKSDKRFKWQELYFALPISIILIVLFVALQKSGVLNFVSSENIGLGTSALIGVVASLSTCMAVVGGLVLSMSAVFSKTGDRLKPQLLFHFGRLASFFVFGGLIGVLGGKFAINQNISTSLALIVGLIMLILGLNLLDLFHGAKRFFTLPKSFSKLTLGLTKANHFLTPFIAGIVTFFLPCGFTQSMQFYTLTTGGFLQGALTMFVFALGTLPVLLIIGLSSYSIRDSKYSGIFFKTAGIIVLAFAFLNIWGALAMFGFVAPLCIF